MNRKVFYSLSLIATLILLASCGASKKTAYVEPSKAAPKAQQEFRAAWVATVANINWPSKPGLSTDEQKKEALALLDFLKTHNFNAVIFQVRPQADALYQSNLEPWSYYLTGQQGKAPEPYYDPLQYWIEEAHNRGLELHVWLNPYRAHHVAGGPVTDSSLVKRRPNLALYLKEGYWWFDPSMKEVQDHSAAVVRDLVRRYDLDGVHFDDYFYPYPSYNKNEDFPDSTTWMAYQASGGKLSRGDWRRKSVNDFIERVYKEIKAEKKHVKFGLSPFGIWRPGYPEGIGGFDQYDVLYADAKLWLNKGWIDYFAPQLYWPINREAQSYPMLLGWWARENTKNRHLWPGISVGRDTTAANRVEVVNEIMISRGITPQSKGVIHWSISSLTRNPALATAVLDGPYKKPALVPASSWLDKKAPGTPLVAVDSTADKVKVSWSAADAGDVFRWVVYYQHGATWNYTILNRGDQSIELEKVLKRTLPAQGSNPAREVVTPITRVAVAAVDRTGNEGERREVVLRP